MYHLTVLEARSLMWGLQGEITGSAEQRCVSSGRFRGKPVSLLSPAVLHSSDSSPLTSLIVTFTRKEITTRFAAHRGLDGTRRISEVPLCSGGRIIQVGGVQRSEVEMPVGLQAHGRCPAGALPSGPAAWGRMAREV